MMTQSRLLAHSFTQLWRKRLGDGLRAYSTYALLALLMLATVTLLYSFTASVDAAGIDYERTAVLRTIHAVLTGIYGEAAVESLFARGPLKLVSLVCFLITSVYFTLLGIGEAAGEIADGSYELLLAGPVTPGTYLLALVAAAVGMVALVLGAAVIFATALCLASNIYVESMLFAHMLSQILLFASVLSLGMLAATWIRNGFLALFAFYGTSLLLLLELLLHLSAIQGTALSVLRLLGVVLRWVSPFHIYFRAAQALDNGRVLTAVGMDFALIAFAIAMLLLARRRLVRRFG